MDSSGVNGDEDERAEDERDEDEGDEDEDGDEGDEDEGDEAEVGKGAGATARPGCEGEVWRMALLAAVSQR